MSEISILQYYVNGKKKYRYRFEIASVNGQRKWKSKSGFDTKSAAMKDAKEAQAVYERKGTLIEPSDMSYSDFFTIWLDAAPFKETTKEGYAKRGRLYIVPRIGALRLKFIKRADLRDILIDMINDGFARNTVSVVKGIIVKSFEFAVEEKYLIDSPAVGLKMPRIERPKKKQRVSPHIFITQEQVKQIFNRFPVGDQNHIPLLIGYSCGLRLGEVFALLWDDIDLDAKTLTVNRQVQWHKDESLTPEERKALNGLSSCGNSYWYFSAPKYGSVRTISMPENLVDVLRQELDRQERAREYYAEQYQHYYESDRRIINQNHDGKEIYFVIVRENGSYINSRSTQYTTKIIHEQVGIPDFDFHSLRHTHASMLAEAGAPANYVSHRLGHKNVSTTLNVYYHLTETMTKNGDKYLEEKFKLP